MPDQNSYTAGTQLSPEQEALLNQMLAQGVDMSRLGFANVMTGENQYGWNTANWIPVQTPGGIAFTNPNYDASGRLYSPAEVDQINQAAIQKSNSGDFMSNFGPALPLLLAGPISAANTAAYGTGGAMAAPSGLTTAEGYSLGNAPGIAEGSIMPASAEGVGASGFGVPGAAEELASFMNTLPGITQSVAMPGGLEALIAGAGGAALGATAAKSGWDALNNNEAGSDWSRGLESAMNPGLLNPTSWLPSLSDVGKFFKDYGKVIGPLAAGGLGALGASEQASAYRDVADKYLSMGQPYRDMLLNSYGPNFTASSIPGFNQAIDASTNSVLKGLSTSGNPYDNPGGLMEAQKYITGNVALPAIQNYRSQLGTFGQLGTNTAGTADMSKANASGGALNAIGYGLNGALNPPTSLEQMLKQLGTLGGGYTINNSGSGLVGSH